MTQIVENNKHVLFSYTIADDDSGEVLELTDTPIAYIRGGPQRLPEKVEQAIAGSEPGDIVEVRLTPEEGFGEIDPTLIFTEQLSNVPPEYQHIGARVQFQDEAGEIKIFVVTEMNNSELVIDGNSPMAGRNLKFSVMIDDIRDASAEEIANGLPSP